MTDLFPQLVRWRRGFHTFPELGFCEYRTAATICETLAALPGCTLRVGRDAMETEGRMGVPTSAELAEARAAALAAGAPAAWVEKMPDGLTGVVAEWTFPRPGPTLAFRVDIDALPITESASGSHLPTGAGFASHRPGRMHACGHDGHAAIGLGLAASIPARSRNWGGKLRLIFQPAEEGCCGAASMVAKGVVDDVDYFVAGHLGTAANETGLVSCGITDALAITKLDVILRGRAAHAGMKPNEGRNALLAAASLVLNLHAISRHADGDTRVNVGELHAGSGRNVIADRADLQLEVRGATTDVNHYMTGEAHRIIAAAAAMHGVEAEIRLVGAAEGARCDEGLKQIVREAALGLPQTTRVVDTLPLKASEDATIFMNAVQRRGGHATYVLIGSTLAAGHHHPEFDFDERSLPHGVDLYAAIADRILSVK